MTTPGDPLTTLGEALNRYNIMHDAMQTASQEITQEEEEFLKLPASNEPGGNNDAFPLGGQPQG